MIDFKSITNENELGCVPYDHININSLAAEKYGSDEKYFFQIHFTE